MRVMKAISSARRLLRMRQMFAEEGGILAEDYEFFMQLGQPDAAKLLNIDFRKLAQLPLQQALEPN